MQHLMVETIYILLAAQIYGSVSEFEAKTAGEPVEVELGTVKQGATITRTFFIKCLQSGTRVLDVKVILFL